MGEGCDRGEVEENRRGGSIECDVVATGVYCGLIFFYICLFIYLFFFFCIGLGFICLWLHLRICRGAFLATGVRGNMPCSFFFFSLPCYFCWFPQYRIAGFKGACDTYFAEYMQSITYDTYIYICMYVARSILSYLYSEL